MTIEEIKNRINKTDLDEEIKNFMIFLINETYFMGFSDGINALKDKVLNYIKKVINK